MLEALVSLRRDRGEGTIGVGENNHKKTGDIIVVKKSPAAWGEMEKKYFLIIKLKDDELEARIKNKSDAIIHPYAEPKSKTENKSDIIGRRSALRVDLSMFKGSDGLKSDITSGAVSPNNKEYLDAKDLIG